MPEVKIKAESRTEFGKGAAMRLRRADLVPAVLYGHGTAPVHVALPGHATMMALKQSNALLNLDVDGKSTLALPKDVQRDPLRGFIEHVDLLVVKRGEKVTVEVPIHTEGELAPGGNLLDHVYNALPVEAEGAAAGWARVLLAGQEVLDATGRAIRRPNGAVVLSGGADGRGPLARRAELEALRGEVAQAARNGEARVQKGSPRWLKRTLWIAGGCTMMGVDGLVGGGLTPVTGGVSLAGAAVSVGFGGAMVGKGL